MSNLRESDRTRHELDRMQHPLLLLRLRLALRAWSLLIPGLALQTNLSRLLSWTSPGSGQPYRGLGAETIWRCCHRTVKRPRLMRDRPCLREGLLLNRFLIMAGYEPTLYFGVDRQSLHEPNVRAHCWVRLGTRVFNPPEPGTIEIHAHASPASQSGRVGDKAQ